MTQIPPRSLGAMDASEPAEKQPKLALVIAWIRAALLPPPRLVPRVGHATLTDHRVTRR